MRENVMVIPNEHETIEPQARRAILLLARSVMLMETGYGIVMPIFAKRLGELGAGVETLGDGRRHCHA